MNNPLPERVTLSHGAGGEAMRRLVRDVFLREFGEHGPADDSALISMQEPPGPLAFTTDSFVVDPLFFPGGDIGRLAVAGTVNDLLTAAAKPLALSASFIIEEGLETHVLSQIARSMQKTAAECGVEIVTGDTKVVPRGSADGLFITTSGVGKVMLPGVSGSGARPGDRVIISGSAGDHGAAVLLAREGMFSSGDVRSDCAPLVDVVMNLIDSGCRVHAMRDPTRGGVAAALSEIACQSGVCIRIDECAVPVKPAVKAVFEALGIDPLHTACEGKMLIVVDPADAERALSVVRESQYGSEACIIGEAVSEPVGRVAARTPVGTYRILDPPQGELVPRIC